MGLAGARPGPDDDDPAHRVGLEELLRRLAHAAVYLDPDDAHRRQLGGRRVGGRQPVHEVLREAIPRAARYAHRAACRVADGPDARDVPQDLADGRGVDALDLLRGDEVAAAHRPALLELLSPL